MSLVAESLAYTYTFRGGSSVALRGISAKFESGAPHLICGPSGSGKSTLSYLLAGLLKPTAGSVLLHNATPQSQRHRIAYVFQFAENIFFEDTLREELQQWSAPDCALDLSCFESLGLDFDAIADRSPFHLSQGYGRLVSIALQLARNPDLLILDEPTIGLDWRFEERVLAALADWQNPHRTLLVITHDLHVMRALGGKAWVLNSGALAWQGDTAALLSDTPLLCAHALDA